MNENLARSIKSGFERPFGGTHGGGANVHYASLADAITCWEKKLGPVVRGATSPADFAQRLWVRAVQTELILNGEVGNRNDSIHSTTFEKLGLEARRVMKLAWLFCAAAFAAVALPSLADVPTASQSYGNLKYGFSVQIPDHLLGCLSENTDDVVAIPLNRDTDCSHVTDYPPFATIYDSYNVATDARTAKELARLYCRGPDVKQVIRLADWMLGSRPAAGCRLYTKGGGIEVKLMTLRKTDPQNPEVWIEVGAYLSTTAARYEHDMREFRKIVASVRIAPDGPQH